MPELHDFNDQDLTDYSGDTDHVDFVTSPALEGSHALRMRGGEGNTDIWTTAAGKTFSKGNTARVFVRFAEKSGQAGFLFGVQDGSNHYVVQLDAANDGFRLFELVSGTIPDSGLNEASFSIGYTNTDRWYELEITRHDGTEGGSDNDLTAKLIDDQDTVLETLTGNSDTYATDTGTGYRAYSNPGTSDHIYVDDAKTDDPEPPAPPDTLTPVTVDATWATFEAIDDSINEDEFHLYRNTSTGVDTGDTLANTTVTPDETGTGSVVAFNATGLSTSTDYYFAATANDTDTATESELSNEVSITTGANPPDASPSIQTVTVTSHDLLSVGWLDNPTNEEGYRVRARPNGTDAWSYVSADLPANTTSHTTDELLDGRTHDVQVEAFTAGGVTTDTEFNANTTDLADVTGLVLTASEGEIEAAMTFDFP